MCSLNVSGHYKLILSQGLLCSIFDNERVGAGTGGVKGERASVAGRPSNLLRYKTELCRTFEENGLCRFGNTCTFAHGIGELRAIPRHPRYKTEPCRQYHTHGYCQYGARCHFVHDPEEAAGVSPMRGFIIRGRHDRLASAMLALAEDAGIVSNPDTSDVLLANLRRLYALRAMKDQPEISDIPTTQEPSEGSEDMSFQSDGLDLSTYLPDNLSARLFETSSNCSMYTSTMSVLGSTGINGNKYDASHEPLMEHNLDASVDNSIDQSIDTGIWSSAWSTTSSLSTSPPGESWWGMWGGSMATPPLSPESRLVQDAPLNLGQPTVTSLPQGIEMDLPSIGMATKFSVKVVTEVIKESVIANPMEVSRGLHLPSIAELCRN
ncbi:uncharacterized protein LOC119582277 [Penaeus monodon]|uniref:uncharacterized protein LOC119582277 n=1 Tax=Penaeus monodon TaxID=6687 RepID=UPI0018A76407|nr:uncharacterized protein LOC119582277 [Penaeus monodon]